VNTSVKMSEDTKAVLDTVQARLVLMRSKRLSQQEILEAMVNFSAEREEELSRYLAGVSLPLPKNDLSKLMSLPKNWGVRTTERDIDSALYGEG
jgi:hypothetical protein